MGPFEDVLAQGLLWAFGTVFLAGMATSLTGCVYPMIPITVAVFGARQAKTRLTAFLLATSYVMGIALMYAALGVGAALTGRAAGGLLASPWLMVPLSLLFVVLATSLFGLWDIRLPATLSERMSRVGGAGFRGAFALGVVGGIVIAPCAGPVLAGLLTWVATTRNALLGGTLLFTYALGIGVLFWLIAVFAVSLPKSGPWMDSVKSALGIALLIVALYFLSDAFPVLGRYGAASSTSALVNGGLIVIGIAIGAIRLTYARGAPWRALRKTAGILLVTLGGFALVNFALTPASKLPWVYTEKEAFRRARVERKPIFIDFWARWCVPCKEMEDEVFTDPLVRREFERFVLFKIDVSEDTEQDQALKKKYRAPQLPQLILLDWRTRERARAHKIDDPNEMLWLLKQIR